MFKNRLIKLSRKIFLSVLLTSFTNGYCGKSPSVENEKAGPLLELKNGYFFFTDSTMKKVYSNGGWDIQLSGSYPIRKFLQIYGSVEYLQNQGKSLFDHQKTSIYEIPVNLGLKPIIALYPWMQVYVASGLRYCYIHQRNSSPYVDTVVRQNGVGIFVNTGLNFIYNHFLIDLFGEYSSVNTKFHAHKTNVYGRNVQVGGLTFGLGLGYAF